MITDYHRPQSIEQAITLLSKPGYYPLGGGTLLTRKSDDNFAVVDLQDLGLDKMRSAGGRLEIGATATLNSLLDSPHIPPALSRALRLEATLNLRNSATVAGSLISGDGRSSFATALLSLDAKFIFANSIEPLSFGDYLASRSQVGSDHPSLSGKLIIKIEIPINIKLAFESVGRSPVDKPIVCVAITRWNSGRIRLAMGGYGAAPILAMDGNEPGGLDVCARTAFSSASDEWASSDYRSEIAAVLASRCAITLSEKS
jgi:putative selenate reductase FAD-binding subunit